MGNVVQVDDAAQSTLFFAGAVVSPTSLYTYDAAYRLATAQGREHASIGVQPDSIEPGMSTLPHPKDANALRNYIEAYAYDAVGNVAELAHSATGASWTRRYQYAPGTNRLQAHAVPGDAPAGPYHATFAYDPAGNMTAMPHLQALEWDRAGRLHVVDRGAGGTVFVSHDAAGHRVRKVWQRQGGLREERLYFGGYELFRRFVSGSLVFERRTCHIEDDHRSVALVETVTVDAQHPGFDSTPVVRYQLTDQIRSATVECDLAGNVLSYEEYHPFGTTALWMARGAAAVSTKRYRYTGKEKDEETSLYCVGARYYAPWLARWTSPDPAGNADGVNRYAYVNNNPVGRFDPTGLEGADPSQLWFSESRFFWADARATAKGRGFTKGLYDYFRNVSKLWGAPAQYDLGHVEKSFAFLKPGEVSKIGIQERGFNQAQGRTVEAAQVAQARAQGVPVRNPDGSWPGATGKVPRGQPTPPTVGAISPKPLASAEGVVAGEGVYDAAAALKLASKPAPPPVTVTGQLFLDPKTPGLGPSTPTSTQLELNFGPAKPGTPSGTLPEQLSLPLGESAPAVSEAAKLPAVAPAATDAAAVSGTTPAAAEAAALTQPAGDTAAIAKTEAELAQAAKAGAPALESGAPAIQGAGTVAKDTGALVKEGGAVVKEAETVAKEVGTVVKEAGAVAKEASVVAKEAGAITKTLSGGAKVLNAAKPILRVVAPVAKVVGEVAKPLGVAVAAVEVVDANNNTDRLVASGDLLAGAAMYCGPVGEAFSLGYMGGGLLDKGVEKASKAVVGVDLSPSHGIQLGLEGADKLVSKILPDSVGQPEYKQQNKVAWFLIDKLGF